MAACSRVGAGYGTAMLDAVLSITVFAAILLVIGAIFTGISILRSYTLRRIFEEIRVRKVWG